MSKLDDMRRKGFVDSTDLDLVIEHNNWNYNKFNKSLPRNINKVKALLSSTDTRVPFIGFSEWLLLYKNIIPQSVSCEELDLYFEEYKIYYEAKSEDDKVININCEYSVRKEIDIELKKLVTHDEDIGIIKSTEKIDIGEVNPVNINYAYKRSMECANALLGGIKNE